MGEKTIDRQIPGMATIANLTIVNACVYLFGKLQNLHTKRWLTCLRNRNYYYVVK